MNRGVPREFKTALKVPSLEDKEDSVNIDVSLVLFHDHVFLKLSETPSWGAVLQCDYDEAESTMCSSKTLIGDRKSLELSLWGAEIASPIQRRARRHVLLSLALPKTRIERLEHLRVVAQALDLELESIPKAAWYKPSDF
eukprot:Blabericola_migrator_1__4600@NODE_2440_length_2756_cov_61_828933_g1528_i0_p3_GENE_NODE_2440_length_2756_cov_61_828933_g1528_i0NODE_2440_length_2756_cov_61_828933_g1528_i0_p3_ORF_typecomplete_len140_score28_74PAC3/PF10178_9/6_1e05_NODE_2440_length_2756_cov_61_828933_g1528_i0529948